MVPSRGPDHAPAGERDIPGHVHISDYTRQVLAPLPERAVTWGSLYFGVDAGVRTELVQFQDALNPALDFKPARRERIVPDFLVLKLEPLPYAVPQMLLNQDNALGNFFLIFPDARYRELKLVYAPPYGAAIVYERVGNRKTLPEPVPAVAINDGSSRQWSTRTSEPLPVVLRPARPVTARIRHYTYDATRAAQATVAADLEPGFYLIDVEVERVSAEQEGFFLASGDLQDQWRSGDSTPLAMTPYLVGSSHAWTVVDYPGGPLYLSRFEKAQMTSGAIGTRSGLSVRSIRRVVPLVAPTHLRETVQLPPLSKWRTRDGIIEFDGAGGYRVIGPAEEPARLLETAVVNLGPNRLATLFTADFQGRASITVTDRYGSPIACPARMPGRVTFESPPDGAVKFVLTGVGELPAGEAGAVTPLAPAALYMDRVMTCRSPVHQGGRGRMRQPEIGREAGSLRRLERGCTALAWVALAIAAAIMLHKSFRFIGTTPLLNVDDSIPNVAVTRLSTGAMASSPRRRRAASQRKAYRRWIGRTRSSTTDRSTFTWRQRSRGSRDRR